MANHASSEWANSGIDLLVELGRGGRLRASLEDGLRDAIRSGRLGRGTRLPPTRTLARDLGVSRGTVLQAYAQLAAEGWIAGRRGSATVVSVDVDAVREAGASRETPPQRWRFDLRPGRPDSSSFPRAEWLRALRRALADAPDDALGYAPAEGQLALRAELAGYLARARGLRVVPADLVVTTGFTQGLGLVVRALAAAGVRRVAMEEPSMPLHRELVRAAGHELVPLPVDADGARVEELASTRGVGAVVLTPNRQHPTGATLGAARRSLLLDWARAAGAVAIEDDYDGEFRYDGRPIGPLQGLDPSLVVYAGTASKTLAPGLRVGWLAVPEPLRRAVVHEKELADWGTSALQQLGFAEFLRGGGYDRHVRRMRLRYRRRRDVLVAALHARLPRLEVRGTGAGLNVVLPLPDAELEAAAIAAAAAAGVGLDGLATGGYHEGGGAAGLIVGYAAAPEHAFERGVEALLAALEAVLR